MGKMYKERRGKSGGKKSAEKREFRRRMVIGGLAFFLWGGMFCSVRAENPEEVPAQKEGELFPDDEKTDDGSSEIITDDRMPPQVSLSTVGDISEAFRVEVSEENWDPTGYLAVLKQHRAGEREGTAQECRISDWKEISEGVWEGFLKIPEDDAGLCREGNWEFTFLAEDREGNLSDEVRETILVDRTDPYVENTEFFCEGEQLKLDETGRVFSPDTGQVSFRVCDDWSGIAKITVWGKRDEEERRLLWEIEKNEPKAVEEFFVKLEEEGDWTLSVQVQDMTGHFVEKQIETRVIVDRSSPKSYMEIRSEAGENGFYTGDLTIWIRAEDAGSGIRAVRLCVDGDSVKESDPARKDGDDRENGAIEENVVICGEAYEGDHLLTLFVRDMAGNETEIRKDIQIDRTSPRVEIEADRGSVKNGFYYAEARKIRIRVTEENFRPESLILCNQDETLGVLDCEPVGKDCYEAEFLAEKDGTYRLYAKCRDLAGNQGESGMLEPFVIDRTPPTVSIRWQDGGSGALSYEGTDYFHESRRAILKVDDVNPWEEGTVCIVKKNGEEERQILKMAGQTEGLSTSLLFEEDGEYQLSFLARDMAGNESVLVESAKFVIDGTKPELSFEGAGLGNLWDGQVRPRVTAWDENMEKGSLEVSLYLTGRGPRDEESGRNAGYAENIPVYLPGNTEEDNGTSAFIYDLWPREKGLDGCYRIEAEARDLAGNTVNGEWNFTVNRFGSVILYGGELLQAEEKYYVNQKPEIRLVEYNPDEIISSKILFEDEDGVRTLRAGKDYTVAESGGGDLWHCNIYRIRPDVLASEGEYRISLHTTDRAGNQADTREEHPLAFFLDCTPPEITVEGLTESNFLPAKREGKLCIRLWDLSGIASARFLLDGEQAASLSRDEIEQAGGTFFLTVPARNQRQELEVEAVDLAGNQMQAEPVSFETEKEESKQTIGQTKEEGENEQEQEKEDGRQEESEDMPVFLANVILLAAVGSMIIVHICRRR